MNQVTQRPNVLFLMSDEHRADVAGFAGNRVVRTPVLDQLAREGVVFRNAYTPSPICIPARQCMAAGQLPRTCRAVNYGDDLPPFSMTFARRFAQHGYAAVCCGKLHHDGPDQMQGWSSRYGGDTQVEPRHIEGRDKEAWSSFRHPSSYRSRDDAGEILRAGVGHGRFTHDRDRYALDGALQFLNHHYLDIFADKPSPDQPVLLKLSFNRPHYPYLTTEPKLQYYLNRVEPFLEPEPFDHPVLGQRHVKLGRDVTERDIRKATATYYGMIEEVDEDYGRIMDALRHVGQDLDQWWIIYTTDHGEMLGEHGVWEKSVFFEGSARVPLIIRPPRNVAQAWNCSGRVVNENVNLYDLFATLCDIAHIPLPPREQTVHAAGLDSRSLVPLMQGQTKDWHERYHNETISQRFGNTLMIKRDALKYQFYDREDCRDPRYAEVLFDLDADPSERRNLISESQYASVLEVFRKRRAAVGFGPDADKDYGNAGYNATPAPLLDSSLK